VRIHRILKEACDIVTVEVKDESWTKALRVRHQHESQLQKYRNYGACQRVMIDHVSTIKRTKRSSSTDNPSVVGQALKLHACKYHSTVQ
jgi:hypothetical protein